MGNTDDRWMAGLGYLGSLPTLVILWFYLLSLLSLYTILSIENHINVISAICFVYTSGLLSVQNTVVRNWDIQDEAGQGFLATRTNIRNLFSSQGSWTRWSWRDPSNSNDSMKEVTQLLQQHFLSFSIFMCRKLVNIKQYTLKTMRWENTYIYKFLHYSFTSISKTDCQRHKKVSRVQISLKRKLGQLI